MFWITPLIANISYHSGYNINFQKDIFSYEETYELFKVIHDTGKAKSYSFTM